MELVIQLAHYPREITLKDEATFITLDLNNIFLRFHSLRLRLFTFVVHKNALYEAFMCVFYGWSKRAWYSKDKNDEWVEEPANVSFIQLAHFSHLYSSKLIMTSP